MIEPERRPSPRSSVCLLLEGTYPFVAGGVSSWVHDIVRSLPELTFSLVHIGAKPGAYGAPRYELPPNITGLDEHYCYDHARTRAEQRAAESWWRFWPRLRGRRRGVPRMLTALRRLHLEDSVDDQLLDDLAANDLSVSELLHGDAAFDVITEIAHARAPRAPFLEFFWHFRSMHVPLLRLLGAEMPAAGVYHSVSTGYAGAVAAVASRRTKRPMLLTEHGIYARERDIELQRASWISEREAEADLRVPIRSSSALRRFWSRFFVRLSQIAYHQARRIVTLSMVNLRKQLDDGAARERTMIVPNGVDVDALDASEAPAARPLDTPLRVGFVGRVVHIKDVLTFIRACDLALRETPIAVEVIGPTDEDPAYMQRCRALVETLGRTNEIRFVGPRKPADIYRNLDVCVLTSFSEGQPLVMLEAGAAGVPVIATDVGACREMIEGTSDPEDIALGAGGIVTRVAAPDETAAAIVRLARDDELRQRFGAANRRRAHRSYAKSRMIRSYRELYQTMEAGS
jgi:glycosyltransferase involved in cell wall biosynthesis